ncbi:MAG: M48 family metallopeptidase [Dehalococcoidia bacterium]
MIPCSIVRSKRRRKTISIRVSAESGVRVAVPMATSEAFIRDLVAKRSSWILKRLAAEASAVAPARRFVSGETLPYLGEEHPLLVETSTSRRVAFEFIGDAFRLFVPPFLEGEARETVLRRAVLKWYREQSESAVTRSATLWSAEMHLSPKAVLVRDQRRRWGSCGPDGTLRFNWRLVLAPPAILDFVVVHELAHLAQRNHSPAFWGVVEKYLPDHKSRRKWLRENGTRLNV